MAHYLSTRGNWQSKASNHGADMEDSTADYIRQFLHDKHSGEYSVWKHPKDLEQIYIMYDVKTDPTLLDNKNLRLCNGIYEECRNGVWKKPRCGVIPDICIHHMQTNKRYFIECKHQNAAGNAHERACKFATPGMIQLIKEAIDVQYHPVGYMFEGGIATCPKYIRELKATYSDTLDHLLIVTRVEQIDAWIENVILPTMHASG